MGVFLYSGIAGSITGCRYFHSAETQGADLNVQTMRSLPGNPGVQMASSSSDLPTIPAQYQQG